MATTNFKSVKRNEKSSAIYSTGFEKMIDMLIIAEQAEKENAIAI